MKMLAKLENPTQFTLRLIVILTMAGFFQLAQASAMVNPFNSVKQNQKNESEQADGGDSSKSYLQSVSSEDSAALLLTKMDELQRQLQSLRGELEVQGHDLKRMREQQQLYQKQLNEQADNKQVATANQREVSASEAIGRQKSESYLTMTSTNPSSNDKLQAEADRYTQAYQLVEQKDFSAAIEAMQQYLTDYPTAKYSSNAAYWLGELYLAQRQPNQAIEEFNTVVEQFPDSSKVGPSMLKLGYAYYELGMFDQARDQLLKVKEKFPDSNIGHLASTKLQSLNQESSTRDPLY